MRQKLKPCNNCGGEDLKVECYISPLDEKCYYYVHCNDCSAETINHHRVGNWSIAAWNADQTITLEQRQQRGKKNLIDVTNDQLKTLTDAHWLLDHLYYQWYVPHSFDPENDTHWGENEKEEREARREENNGYKATMNDFEELIKQLKGEIK